MKAFFVLLTALTAGIGAAQTPLSLQNTWQVEPGSFILRDYNQNYNTWLVTSPIDGRLWFQFPGSQDSPGLDATEGLITYVTFPRTSSIAGFASITLVFKITTTNGSGTITWECSDSCPEGNDAQVYAYFQRINDDKVSGHYRWWAWEHSAKLKDLTLGTTYTMTVPLEPVYWVDTNGLQGNATSAYLAYFAAALANPVRIGLSFGNTGNNAAQASGTQVHGTPYVFFNLMSYTLNP